MSLSTNPFLFRGETTICSGVSTIAVSSATTLKSYQSSAIIAVTSAGANYTITLPAPALGLNFKFYLVVTAGTNTVTISSPTANTLGGQYFSCSTTATTIAVPAVIGTNTSVVFSTHAIVGDTIEMWSDGTNWLGKGFSGYVGAGFTVA